ncbi:alpha/beta fold hydrolase [Paenibacillus methanolicus]|uniref:prolyl aminopeptidase n=1 Tax=Paenibacillus methanolicus TaxID=582686 RepID=A0A5S5C8M5_9BACL|nr:alpha/beta hydrolase [Paenibacillus methanolicus]TYP74680.1 pimeloyl-ACP methyl ester carboxylesterase [Paenibacillus methanolicus]
MIIRLFSLLLSAVSPWLAVATVVLLGALSYRARMRRRLAQEHRIVTEHGIDEELTLEIGGLRQYVNIRGHDVRNPVILYLHGGPGGPFTPVMHKYQFGWERDYTVVNWDQRNAGRTYLLNKSKAGQVRDSLTTDKLVEDVRELVLYLRERFGQEKIIIMGHSWGTVLGSLFAQRYPAWTRAYVSIAQVVQLHDGAARMAGDVRLLALSRGAERDAAAADRLAERLRRDFKTTEQTTAKLHKLAAKHQPYKPDSLLFLKAGSVSPTFSLKQLVYFARREKLQAPLTEYLSAFDLRTRGSAYEVPVIVMLGEFDRPYRPLMEAHYPAIQAPLKQLHVIEGTGHDAMLERPEVFERVLREALKAIL